MVKPIFIMLAVVAVAALCVVIVATRGLSDFDLERHRQHDVSFAHGGAMLSGTLVLPDAANIPPVVVIVHGDGAQDRFSGGGYLPLINILVDAGMGVFTWDKAGVGDSTGNWLDQTMQDRTNEAMAASRAIAALDTVQTGPIGYLGFSQAGWVLPRVANRTSPAFTVIVGGAVSWRDQGTYYTRVELQAEGLPADQIDAHLTARTLKYDALFNNPDAEPPQGEQDPDRFRFVARAYAEDATHLIAGMQGPVLAMWGADDLNVDPQSDAQTYRDQLAPLSDIRQVVVVPDATHGLLRADLFNYQLASDWPWHLHYVFLGLGRDAFAPHSFDEIAAWILAVAKE